MTALRAGFGGAVAVVLCAAVLGGSASAAPRHASAESSLNKVHEKLLKMSPPEQAAVLARVVGHWCIGTEAFPMGLVTSGNGEGNAYWSLRCADGTAWAVQIDPLAQVTAIDCETFKVHHTWVAGERE